MGLIEQLREQPFYVGQILRRRTLPSGAAETLSVADLFQRVLRLKNSTLERILPVLGFDEAYAAHLGILHRAFPEDEAGGRDAVLVAPWSAVRELAWQLVCLVEAIDEGRRCLVLCRDRGGAEVAAEQLRDTVRRADIEYAVELAVVTEPSGFSALDRSLPLIIVFTPETFRSFLHLPGLGQAREIVLSALGRVALPNLDGWPPALASHVAYLMRELHVECAARGVFPALVGTASRTLHLQGFASELWGKQLEGSALVEKDSVESPSIDLVNYSGGLVRSPSDPRQWVRQAPRKVASDLLDWLVGRYTAPPPPGIELHYVLDTSGSMAGRLPAVGRAVVKDLELKLENGGLKHGDRVRLTVFDTTASEVFSQEVSPSLVSDLRSVVENQKAGGGTDLPEGLGAALEIAWKGAAGSIHIILFSDGESPVTAVHRGSLLRLAREARAAGRVVRILYVVLDMEPPAETKNLILAMGGRVLRQSIVDLERGGRYDAEDEREGRVGFLSGEQGLPDDVIQPFQAGRRPLVFARDVAKLRIPSMDVTSVVVSGRFGSLRQIHDQVRHLGRESVLVFLLTEAEAWAQLLTEDYPEVEGLAPIPLITPRNTSVARMRLLDCVGSREIDASHFRYLVQGPIAYGVLMKELRVSGGAATQTSAAPPFRESELPPGLELVRREVRWFVRALADGSPPPGPEAYPLDTFSEDRIRIEGLGILDHRDRAVAPIVHHPGAILDSADSSAEVAGLSADRVELRARSGDRYVPILERLRVRATDAGEWTSSRRAVDRLGTISLGPVEVEATVPGSRCYRGANLDDRYNDQRFGDGIPVQYETCAAQWKPRDASLKVLSGLANILRLTLVTVLREVDQTILVCPDFEASAIWLVDLAPGGNGAATLLGGDPTLLQALLALGGRIALECPCEGGLAGATTMESKKEDDTGCPRCTRMIGPVILDGGIDRFSGVSKKDTLEWLLQNGHLPGAAKLHIEEKYAGITDPLRISGDDQVSRRGLLRLVRRILRDRLGLEMSDGDVARFKWLETSEPYLGLYDSGSNELAMVQGLREWMALDVCGHEFFHNLQYRLTGLFLHTALGHGAAPPVPFDGKLFIEGSAMWAESHVVDALALRSSLDLANLRQGDEYGVGFRLIKLVEEQYGGVSSVLALLATGDIAKVTRGEIRDLQQLYSRFGTSP